MAAPRNRRHIIVPTPGASSAYTPHLRKITPKRPPTPEDPKAHSTTLVANLRAAVASAEERREQAALHAAEDVKPGVYVEFESPAGFDLKLESLETLRSGIELLAVREEVGPEGTVERATVFVPDSKVESFIKKFEQYAKAKTKKGARKNAPLVESVAAARLATLRDLWADPQDTFPADGQAIWWEVWLRRRDGNELERLTAFAAERDVIISDRRLVFEDRVVVLVRATPEQLSASLDVLGDLAEVHAAKQIAALLKKADPRELANAMAALVQRTQLAPAGAPFVALLDTGVNRAHPLLQHSIAAADLHTYQPGWGANDHDGHGTQMAGLSLYGGDLRGLLGAAAPVVLRHRLESVKILPPPPGANDPDLWGAITAECVARVEIANPNRKRAFSMSVAAEDTRDRGRPTSWSAAIDAIAAGRTFDQNTRGLTYLDEQAPNRRLFIVCAGNVDTTDVNHLDRSDIEPVHDPGQAWNALTVGACTDLTALDPADPSLQGWTPVAEPGDLSPYSATSVTFESQWPVKPEIVMEGGNKAADPPRANGFQIDDLSLVTTNQTAVPNPFSFTWATSAATAQASRIAGALLADYPDLWPETIRALLVHSARWTPRMRAHLSAAEGKRGRMNLVRRYGFGVPTLERASRSASDALTLIVQDSLRPFEKGKMREMKLHPLPWPADTLAQLGETAAELRVTLSYFVEPNPGNRGWRKRHRYASHGMRFEVKRPTESTDEFQKRVNKKALAEDEGKPTSDSDSSEWFLGDAAKKSGSIHSDVWVGTAADLAERGAIGVFPVSGWWKDQPKRDRSEIGARYALIVSIETEAQNVDIWTPVAQQVGIVIPT